VAEALVEEKRLNPVLPPPDTRIRMRSGTEKTWAERIISGTFAFSLHPTPVINNARRIKPRQPPPCGCAFANHGPAVPLP
jgi:hypothetical protein